MNVWGESNRKGILPQRRKDAKLTKPTERITYVIRIGVESHELCISAVALPIFMIKGTDFQEPPSRQAT